MVNKVQRAVYDEVSKGDLLSQDIHPLPLIAAKVAY